jgi:hypothetical protein
VLLEFSELIQRVDDTDPEDKSQNVAVEALSDQPVNVVVPYNAPVFKVEPNCTYEALT